MIAKGWEQLKSFLIVAEELNFRAASEILNIDQSGLSRRIQNLEHSIGFNLFDRSTQKVLLTAAGQVFYEKTHTLIPQYQRGLEEAQRVATGDAGQLKIAYMAFAATAPVPDAISRFKVIHPEVQLQLVYIQTKDQKIAIDRGTVDLGYMIGPYASKSCNSFLVGTERLLVVAKNGHHFENQKNVQPAQLAGENLILGDMTEWGTYRAQLNNLFAAEGVELNVQYEASSTLAFLGLVNAGLGVTIYPESMMRYLSARSLFARPIANIKFEIQTVLVWKKNNASKLVDQFIEVAKKVPAD